MFVFKGLPVCWLSWPSVSSPGWISDRSLLRLKYFLHLLRKAIGHISNTTLESYYYQCTVFYIYRCWILFSNLLAQLINRFKSDRSDFLFRALIALQAIFVSPANFDILHVIRSSLSFIYNKDKLEPNTEPWGSRLFAWSQLDEKPFTTTLCFHSESRSLNQLWI